MDRGCRRVGLLLPAGARFRICQPCGCLAHEPPFMRRYILLGAVLLVLAGCGSKEKAETTRILLHWHFAGPGALEQVSDPTETKRLWSRPETRALWNQTLDKLARAPRHWGLDPNATAPLLRPLLSDLFETEHAFQWVERGGRETEWILAVRLAVEKRGRWQTNLYQVLGSWTRQDPAPDPASGGWRWTAPAGSGVEQILVALREDWLLMAGGPRGNGSLARAWLREIQARHRPVPPSTQHWARLRVDWPALARRLPPWLRDLDLPLTDTLATTSGERLQFRTELQFAQPHGWQPVPWLFPSNLIREPLVGFCAMRGIAPRLQPWMERAGLKISPTPNQFCAWSLASAPFQIFAAVPVNDPTNTMRELCRVLPPWFNTNSQGRALGWWVVPTNFPAIIWDGMPFFGAFCRPVSEPAGQGFIFAGLFPNNAKSQPPPPALYEEILSRTNLVYYDWELGGERVRSWQLLSQVALLLADRQQLAPTTAGARWMSMLTTNVANVGTSLVVTGPRTMLLTRTAPLGLTGLESVLLAHWLEAPGFPWSWDWPAMPQPKRRSATNATPRQAR